MGARYPPAIMVVVAVSPLSSSERMPEGGEEEVACIPPRTGTFRRRPPLPLAGAVGSESARLLSLSASPTGSFSSDEALDCCSLIL
jgi:hypothetical protein